MLTSHVKREKEYHRGFDQHLRRPDDCFFEEFAGGCSIVVFGAKIWVRGLLDQALCFAGEDCGSVGFMVEEKG